MKTCLCDLTFLNTGRPSCMPMQDAARKLILVPLAQADGTLNRITLADTFDKAYVDAAINNADPYQRWYPIGNLLNVEDVRGDDVVETFEDGTSAKVQDAPGTFTAIIINQTPDYLRKIISWGCTTFGAYVVDKQGNLIGDTVTDPLYMAPLPINSATWSPKYIKTTDTTVPKVQLNFEWRQDFTDDQLGMVLASEFSGIDLLDIAGLVDLYGAVSNEATTGFTMTITTDYGSAKTRAKVSGLVAADFDLNELTPTPGAEPFTVVESADGVYDFTITTPASSTETFALGIDAATLGYDDTYLVSETITIP